MFALKPLGIGAHLDAQQSRANLRELKPRASEQLGLRDGAHSVRFGAQ